MNSSNSATPCSSILISILIPVFNEAENVEDAYKSILSIFSKYHYNFEIIFTDNHSTDATFDLLKNISANDKRVKVIRFSRNYGFQRSLFTAYCYSSGDACIQIDCDLQDPLFPLIPVFIELWENGHDVVVGIREHRQENYLLSFSRKIFYILQNIATEENVTKFAGDFRLVDRTVVDKLTKINDPRPYVRGIISSLSTNEIGVPYSRNKRRFGKSKFPFLKLTLFAIESILGNSTMPLRIASFCGLFISCFCILLSFIYFFGAIFFGTSWPSGFATNIILTLFGIGMNAIFLGIIGEYLSRIYQQLRNKPLVITEEFINISKRNF